MENILGSDKPVQHESSSRDGILAEIRDADPFSDPVRTALNARSLLPDLHLTIASVIQGITIAIIGDEIYRFTAGFQLPFHALTVYTFGIYAVASFLFALLFWTRFVHGGILTYRSFTYVTNAAFFALAISQILAFRSIGQPAMWSFWAAITALVSAALHSYTFLSLSRTHSSGNQFVAANKRVQKMLAVQMFVIGMVSLVGCVISAELAASLPMVPAVVGTLYVVLLFIAISGSYKRSMNDPFARWVYHDDISALEHLLK